MNLRPEPARPYRSAVRADRARATRARITASADELFSERGYTDTTMAAIAEHAGVAVQTLYNSFGSKPALLKHVYDVRLAGDDEAISFADRPEVRAVYAQTDPRTFLLGYAALGRGLLDRLGTFVLALRAGAAAGDMELIAHLATTDNERLIGTAMVARRLDELHALRNGVTVDRARDAIWTLNSVQVWELLTVGRGWTAAEYEAWVGEAMCAAVLAAP